IRQFGALNEESREVEVPTRGASVLIPQFPISRFRGIVPGRTWSVRLVDPLGGGVGELLEARVELDRELIVWHSKSVVCRVTTCTGPTTDCRMWIRAIDDCLLEQQVTTGEQIWRIVRSPY